MERLHVPAAGVGVAPVRIGTGVTRRALLLAAKRGVDVVAAAVLLGALVPLIGVFALLVKRASPGPAFYAQVREGAGGRRFRMWKLRTMVPDAEARLAGVLTGSPAARREWRRTGKLRDDPRVVPGVGAVLRRWSVDELPQLVNVVRGEMSLVGPRPLPPYHVRRLDPVARVLRRRMRPGMTGLWQVRRRGDAEAATLGRLDRRYVEDWSPWLDLWILGRTMAVVAGRRGAS